ncbi:hypothetical protein Fmac_015308 [Flemingia macrophylla]|uniref:Uncharacterized protein n=1 Tax=Flemingia macrophylla TaxID=520843 RepID=A0ABD1ME72_9FABA
MFSAAINLPTPGMSKKLSLLLDLELKSLSKLLSWISVLSVLLPKNSMLNNMLKLESWKAS